MVFLNRTLPSLFITVGVPVAVFFVLTAAPARLYAESATDAGSCTTAPTVACADAAAGGACTSSENSGMSVCQPALCNGVAGGPPAIVLRCTTCASDEELADCVGKDAGATCGPPNAWYTYRCSESRCAVTDGATPLLACNAETPLPPDAGPTKPAVDSGGKPKGALGEYASDVAKRDGGAASPPAPRAQEPAASSPESAGSSVNEEGCSSATATRAGSGLGPASALLVAAFALLTARRRKR